LYIKCVLGYSEGEEFGGAVMIGSDLGKEESGEKR